MESRPFEVQSPQDVAEAYGGDKQKIAQAMQMGLVDPTAGLLAGMFIDRMRAAAQIEQAPKQSVAQQVFTPPVPQMPPQGMQVPQQAGLGALPPGAAPDMGAMAMPSVPEAAPVPVPEEAPVGMAGGGLSDLPIPDTMFDEPSNGGYGGGGLVAFGPGGEVSEALNPNLRWMQSQVTSPYGAKRSYEIHPGTDYGIGAGTPIGSIAPGVVTFAGERGPNGNLVIVRHPDGTSTSYAHLSKIGVQKGEEVGTGELLGLSGSTGRSSGPHLHFGARNAEGQRVNPGSVLSRLSALQSMPLSNRAPAPAPAPAAATTSPAPAQPTGPNPDVAALRRDLAEMNRARADDLAAASQLRRQENWVRLGLAGLQMLQPQGVRRMAGGGVTALTQEAAPSSYYGYSADPAKMEAQLSSLYKPQREAGAALDEYFKGVLSPEAQNRQRKEDLWFALAQLGATMASTPGNVLQGAAAGINKALPGMQASAKARRDEQRAAIAARAQQEGLNNKEAFDYAKIVMEGTTKYGEFDQKRLDRNQQARVTTYEQQMATARADAENATQLDIARTHADATRYAATARGGDGGEAGEGRGTSVTANRASELRDKYRVAQEKFDAAHRTWVKLGRPKNDDPRANKAEAAQAMIDAYRTYQDIENEINSSQVRGQQFTAAGHGLTTDINGRRIVFENGEWVYP